MPALPRSEDDRRRDGGPSRGPTAPRHATVRAGAAVTVLVAALALGGCSGGGDTSSSAAGGAAGAPAREAPQGAGGAADAGGGVARGAVQGAGASGRVAALDAAAVKPRIVRTAQVVVRVDGELAAAAAKVRAAAQGLGGTVTSETTVHAGTRDGQGPGAGAEPGPGATGAEGPGTEGPGTEGPGTGATGTGGTDAGAQPGRPALPGQSILVVRVPEPDLDRALALVTGPGGVGTELSRSATAQDVTGDLADLESRVATQRASVERVRALLGRAGSLRDVVLLEAEVAKREAELEAVQARRTALADRAELATLTVDLRTREVPVEEAAPSAFLQGLRSGWDAVVASTSVILTVLGALLPVAVVVALLGLPLLWWRRRSGRGTPTPGTPPTPPPPSHPPAAGPAPPGGPGHPDAGYPAHPARPSHTAAALPPAGRRSRAGTGADARRRPVT